MDYFTFAIVQVQISCFFMCMCMDVWVSQLYVCAYACVCSKYNSMCSYHSLVKAHILIETLMWCSSRARNILVSSLNVYPPEKTALPRTLLRGDCFLLSGSVPSFILAESIGAGPDQEQPANRLNSDLWPCVQAWSVCLDQSDSSPRNWKTKRLTQLMVGHKAIECHEKENVQTDVQTDIIRIMKKKRETD